MAMKQAAFEALIARMERLAAQKPAAYRWRVFGLAILGYGYLMFVVLVLLALCALILSSVVYLKQVVALKLFFVVGAPLLLVLRSMWVKLEPPSGERLTRQRVPDLFQILDRLGERLQTPALHNVVLTPEFNAGVMRVPRLGLFDWHRTYLLIGLPLMKSLSVEQFQAVLAHELGHLSRGHARAANWIYRLRLIWLRLEAAFSETPQWGSGLIRAFFKWYIPHFTAASFPLARANEYEADAASVQLTSARSAAQALTALSVVGSYLTEKYWPTIQASARELPQPASAPYSGFVASAVLNVPADQLRRWQDTALARQTSHADTHPSLRDRLKAMGVEAEFAPPSEGESAERLLDVEQPRMASAFDARWRERVAESWRQVHESTRANRLRIADLRSEAAQAELDEQKALELASLEKNVGEGSAAALAMRRSLAEKHPESLPARFALARQLLQSGDAEGVAPMESVIAKAPDALLAGAELLRDFYWRRNEVSLATQWHERLVERATLLQAARREREQLLLSDLVVGHRLSGEALAQLTTQLKTIPDLTCAYLVRKLTRHFSETPMYVLGFKSAKWWSLGDRARANAVLHQIRQEVVFPGETLIVNLEASNSPVARKASTHQGVQDRLE